MSTRVRLVVVASAVTAVIAVVAVQRRRRPAAEQPLTRPEEASPDWLRRFVATRFNPTVVRLGLVGGRRSPWAFLEHVGRTSGRVYRTPVLPMLVGDHAYVPLPYGSDVHWVRNVRTAGHCRIQRRGATYELDEPSIITATDHPGVPAWYRRVLEARGRRYIRLHVLAVAPGDLDANPAAARAPAAPSPAVGSGAPG